MTTWDYRETLRQTLLQILHDGWFYWLSWLRSCSLGKSVFIHICQKMQFSRFMNFSFIAQSICEMLLCCRATGAPQLSLRVRCQLPLSQSVLVPQLWWQHPRHQLHDPVQGQAGHPGQQCHGDRQRDLDHVDRSPARHWVPGAGVQWEQRGSGHGVEGGDGEDQGGGSQWSTHISQSRGGVQHRAEGDLAGKRDNIVPSSEV